MERKDKFIEYVKKSNLDIVKVRVIGETVIYDHPIIYCTIHYVGPMKILLLTKKVNRISKYFNLDIHRYIVNGKHINPQLPF